MRPLLYILLNLLQLGVFVFWEAVTLKDFFHITKMINSINSVSKSIYKKMDCFNCKWNCKFIDAKSVVYPCIDNITVSDVMSEIDLYMQSH